MVVDLARGAGLHDVATRHDGDPSRHRERLFLIVRHEDERRADLAMDPRQLRLHLLAELEIERTEWFVQEQDGRSLGQGARQRDALLLPAGHLGWHAPTEPTEPDEVQILTRPTG